MDWEKGVSRFNSPEFVRVLEFCKKNFDAKSKFDSDLDELELAEQKIRESKSLKEKTTMLEKMSVGCHGIWSLIADIGQCGIFLEDASLLKYPNGGGSGYIDYGNLISVMETCGCKEGAWEFVSYYLGEDYHSRHGFHGSNFTNKALFEKGLEATIAKDGKRRMEDYSYTYDNGKIKVDFSFPRTATAEEAAYYRDIVLSCDRLSFENLTLTGILCEEFDRYLHDEITAEECAEIIANRIDIYVSEKS